MNAAQVFGQVLNTHELSIHNLTIQIMAMEEALIDKGVISRQGFEDLCKKTSAQFDEIGAAYKSGIEALETYMGDHPELTSKILPLIDQKRKIDQAALRIIRP